MIALVQDKLKKIAFVIIITLSLLGILWLLLDSVEPYISPDATWKFISEPYYPMRENSATISIDFRTTTSEDPQKRIFSRAYGVVISESTLAKYPNCFVIAIQDKSATTLIHDQNGSAKRVAMPDVVDNGGGFINYQPLRFSYANFIDSFCPKQESLNLFGPYYVHEKAHSVGGISQYFYPFDTMIIDSIIWISPVDVDNSTPLSLKIVPSLAINILSDQEWHVDITSSEINDGIDTGKLVHIVFRRQLLYIVLYPLIIFFLLILIVALPAIKNTDTYLTALIGLLFGVWGIRQILLPNYITWPTFLDPIIIAFYMLVVIGALLKFTLRQNLTISPDVENVSLPQKSKFVRRSNKKRH